MLAYSKITCLEYILFNANHFLIQIIFSLNKFNNTFKTNAKYRFIDICHHETHL